MLFAALADALLMISVHLFLSWLSCATLRPLLMVGWACKKFLIYSIHVRSFANSSARPSLFVMLLAFPHMATNTRTLTTPADGQALVSQAHTVRKFTCAPSWHRFETVEMRFENGTFLKVLKFIYFRVKSNISVN